MSENIWYPLSTPGAKKMNIQKAQGIYLYDQRGKEYLDANSGLWNVSLGYGNQAIQSSMISQIQKMSYLNPCEFVTDVAERHAELLKAQHHKDIERIIYTCSGSESVEVAIKLMRKYASLGDDPNANGIVVIKNSYHGNYYGSMSVSDYDGREREGYGPLLNRIYSIDLPFCQCCRTDRVSDTCTEKMKQTLRNELDSLEGKVSGFILEPVLGSAGVIPLPKWFVKEIADYAKERDILVAFDEVAVGFGRSGTMFCYEQYDVLPDIVTMSKGINNGSIPMGAVAVSKKVTDRFLDSKEFLFHLSTQNMNAVGCAAGIAMIEELNKNDRQLLKQVNQRNRFFMSCFSQEIETEFEQIFEIRNRGLMFGIEIKNNDLSRQIGFNELMKLVELMKKNGVILEWSYLENLSSCMVLFLPFIIKEAEIEELIGRMKKTFLRLLKN